MYRIAKSASGAFGAALLAGAVLVASPSTQAAQLQPASQAAAPSTQSNMDAPRRVQPDRVEARINELKKRLMITPQQESKWDAFAQTMRDNATRERELIESRNQRLASLNAVDDMKSYYEITKTHSENVGKLVPAFQDLYASMSPEQQRNADQVFASFAERRAAGGAARHASRTGSRVQ